jgi:hypothetical protein|tara:strand:+ start:1357 stop:1536 length:180 start_codon:yes stop_codon:yes gene_type:complete
MNHMPCSITDDPYNDASDYFEGKHVYKSEHSDDENDTQIEMYDKQFALNIGLGPLIKDK